MMSGTSVLANQPLASESELTRDQCQSAGLRDPAGQSEFFVPVSRLQTSNLLYWYIVS